MLFFINDFLLTINELSCKNEGTYSLTYLLSLGKYKNKPEVKLVHVEKLFSKNYGLRKILKEKKKNYNINVLFCVKQIVES